MTTALPCDWRGRPAVALRNESIEVKIVTGGGHIVSIVAAGDDDLNPLWQPPWPTVDPALRKLAAQTAGVVEPGELEDELLVGIAGLNLCCDVFGAHSAGETAQGLCFHGEAGLVTWEVQCWDAAAGRLTMAAELRRTALRVSRVYSLDGPVLRIDESLTSTAGFERPIGRAQHVSLGDAFLLDAEVEPHYKTAPPRQRVAATGDGFLVLRARPASTSAPTATRV